MQSSRKLITAVCSSSKGNSFRAPVPFERVPIGKDDNQK